MYFYVNTLSGYEPKKVIAANPPVQNSYAGNINAGNITTNFPNAYTMNWANLIAAAGAPTTAAFVDLWNNNLAGNIYSNMQNRISNAGLNGNSDHMFKMMGSKREDFLTTNEGTLINAVGMLPRALDKKYKDGLMANRHKAASALVTILKDLELKSFTAKKDLIEVAENIDLYLSSFTDSMLSKPESLLSLAKILQRVAIVRKMYTDLSGDNLTKVFDAFPINSTNYASIININAPLSTNNGESSTRKAGQPLSAVGAPGNSREFKGDSHYYDYVSELSREDSAVGNHKIALDLSSLLSGTTDKNDVTELMKNIEKSVLGVRTLENILLTFVQLGNEQTTQTFLSHGKMLKSLFNYVTLSSISRHYASDNVEKKSITPNDSNVNLPILTALIPSSPFSLAGSYDEMVSDYSATGPLKLALTISLNHIENYGTATNFVDDFKTTDKILELIMKAVCSKVLTVLGLYVIRCYSYNFRRWYCSST